MTELIKDKTEGEGSTARDSSARKNCSTPKSRLLDIVRADVKKTAFQADASFRPK